MINLLSSHKKSSIAILLYIAWWIYYVLSVYFEDPNSTVSPNHKGEAMVMFSFMLFFVYLGSYLFLLLASQKSSRLFYLKFLFIVLLPLIVILSLIQIGS